MKQIFLFLSILAMTITSTLIAKPVTYKIGKDTFEGYYSKADGKSKGLVVVIHDWDGLTDYEIKRVKMLNKAGYDAFALDLYGKGNRPVETKLKKAETGKLYNDRQLMRTRILSGLAKAREFSKAPLAVLGYCFGGAAVLELARSNQSKEVKSYATFHGGLQTPEGQKYTESAPIFIAHGGADEGIPLDHVSQLASELEQAKIEYEIEIYSGAPHAFTVIGSDRYQKKADEKSWTSYMNFLEKTL